MNEAIANLEPAALWKHFAAISAIPRCSRNEAAVRAYVQQQADQWGLAHQTDATGNIVVRRPGSGSAAGHDPVTLQGHLDMVCEKNMDVEHDFSQQGLRLLRDGEWLHADRTTLGADNGIAVAMMLALLETPPDDCPPLECLFTVDEETGLTGAVGLDPALLHGRRLINLDSEEEGFFCIGCAGGRNTYGTLPLVWQEPSPAGLSGAELRVTGLRGGHSGVDIHEGRGNAIRLAARVLHALRGALPALQLGTLSGGDKHNAIPRECRAELAVPGAEFQRAADLAAEMEKTCRAEFGDQEPKLSIELVAAPALRRVLSPGDSGRLIDLLLALPHGVLGMSREVAGLVETSSNLAAVRIEEGQLKVLTSQRSSRGSLVDWASGTVAAAVRLAGGTVSEAEGYPAWPPRPDSPLAETAQAVFRDLHGRGAELGAIHAGLECGVIGDRVGGMDMISLGPDMLGVHTPDERLSIPSTQRTWTLLRELVARL